MCTLDPDAAMERICPVLMAGAIAAGKIDKPQRQGNIRCIGPDCAWWGGGHCSFMADHDLLCEIRNYLSELPGTLKTVFDRWE